MLVISNRKMNVDPSGVLHNDDEDAGGASSSHDNLSRHDLLDLGEGFALLQDSAPCGLDSEVRRVL